MGAGHDGAADELAERMRHRGFAVHQHDFIELLPASLGYHVRRVYASQLRLAPGSWSWLMRVTGRRTLAGAVGALTTLAAGSSLLRAIASSPAVVVSTHHLVSQVLGRLRSGGRLAAPAVTFLTDMSVHRLWVSEGVDVHLAIGPSAMAQARALKAGMVYACAPAVSAMFRPVRCAAERRRAREYFGLPANSPIALIVAGSWGAGDVVRTARDIAESGLAVPVVACGRNERLRRRIARAGTGQALGWVDEMADLLRACEVVVQNAGGLTSLQSLATGVPMLTYRPIPGHGLANAAALDRAGLAPWVHDRVQLQAALRRALDGSKREPRLVRAWPATDPAALVEAVAMRWATTTGEMSRIHDRRPISTRGNPTAQPLPEEVPM
ncbi:MAG: MGDG synthase family glycosyltransferase [Streptosporangiales bacterium]